MNHRRLWTTAALAGAALAALAPAPLAFAQTQDEESASASQDIVVTARRREERLLEVPVAVTAITGDALDAAGAQDITAVAQTTPNVTLEVSRGTNTTLTAFIRGVGQQDPVAGFEQGVGIYLDDVYLNRPQAAVLDIYDVERVELLRGPQGTLYGRNTIGGAVKYVTRRLDADEAETRIRASYGSYNQADLVLSASTPITEEFRVGGALARLTRDGFGDNLTTGEENYNKDLWAVRLSAELEPTPDLLFRISGDYTQDDSAPRQGRRLIPSTLQPSPILDFYDTRAGITRTGVLRNNDISAWGVQFAADWRINDALTLKSISAYRQDDTKTPIDFDSTAVDSFDVPAVYDNKQFSQEFQALLTGQRWDGVLGFYYLDANAFNAFDVILANAVFGRIASFTLGDVDTSTWAIFGEFTYDLTDTLSLTVGGRYTEDERTSRIVRETFIGNRSPFFGGTGASITAPVVVNGQQVVPEFNGTRTDEDFNPRVILAYQPSRDLNLYASYSEGFKGGGFDPRGNFANADVRRGFLPETVESYELGAKARLFGGRATVNSAVFTADYTDVQIPGSVIVQTPAGANFVGTVTNAGAAEFSGVELESSVFLTDALTFNGAVGYIDAEYTQFVVNGVNVASQRDVQNTPDWTGSASLAYTIPAPAFGRDGSLTLLGAASYRGETQQFEFAIPLLDQEGYTLLDASIVWTSADQGLRLGLYGRNLTDERYITSGYNFPGAATDNSVLAFYGNPLTVTGTIELRF